MVVCVALVMFISQEIPNSCNDIGGVIDLSHLWCTHSIFHMNPVRMNLYFVELTILIPIRGLATHMKCMSSGHTKEPAGIFLTCITRVFLNG